MLFQPSATFSTAASSFRSWLTIFLDYFPTHSSIYREMRASMFIVILATALASVVHAAPVPSNPSIADSALAARCPSALKVDAGNDELWDFSQLCLATRSDTTFPRSPVITKRLPDLSFDSLPNFFRNLISIADVVTTSV
ncbi:hypothetical protein FA95DRAFT_1562577 [Auriscalpium vulgare]|uniref:Uncharacterized protein n=1 Tax=Auriscalpium vulgare TaxID=40419 RepID=A0ACB8RIU9_9AGAM|nr:hypothetical protein FA95DRAFT_1562577 [Auriscalpium vulgare]